MSVNAPITSQAAIAKAISQIGVHESPSGSNKTKYGVAYGMNGVAWCDIFQWWVLHDAGWTNVPKFSYTPTHAQWYKDNGAWLPASQAAHAPIGSHVFFNFPNDGVNRISHIGMKEGMLADGRVATIEGNTNPAGGRTGGEVMRHNRSVSGGIVGFGVITYKVGSAPAPQPPSGETEKQRTSELQHLVGVAADGIWGPNTAAACGKHMVGWKHPNCTNEKPVVAWLQKQGNRKYGLNMAVDGLIGPATNHLIVNGLRQADGVCGPNGFREAVR